MQKTKLPYYEMISLTVGELIVSAITALIFLCLGKFELAVILGAALGTFLALANFFALSISSTNAINRALSEIGEEGMDDEAAAEFGKKHQAKIQLIMTVSYIVRMASLLGALIVAFIFSGIFNPIATAVPLLLFRPILMISQILSGRRSA